MATVTKSWTEYQYNYTNYPATWTTAIAGQDITVSGDTIVYPYPSIQVKYVKNASDTRSYGWGFARNVRCYALAASNQSTKVSLTAGYYYYGSGYGATIPNSSMTYQTTGIYKSMSSGTYYTMSMVNNNEYTSQQFQVNTSVIFNEDNNTTKKVNVYLGYNNNAAFRGASASATDVNKTQVKFGHLEVSYTNFTGSVAGSITLNAPPTATVSDRVIDNSYGTYYAGKTSVYAVVSNMTAYYGGNFTDGSGGVKFEIGAQSTTTIDAQHKMYITVDTPGTFTPKVTVTDSRGQTYTKSLEPITVIEYKPTATILNLQRINANGEPEDDPSPGTASDEGTNAIIACRFFYPTFDGMTNNLLSPIVSIDGSAPTNNVEWYRSWTEAGGFSNPVTFPSYENVRPVTLYGKIIDTLATDTSYEISVACDTTLGPGNYDFKLLPQAFYLLSAPEGGHGLGVGMKVPPEAEGRGFHVGMDAIFYENVIFQKMAGVIQMFAGSTAPSGWLLCDGSEYLKTDYPLLYAVIGDAYGDTTKGAVAPSDSDHFRVPDFRGRTGIGTGNGTATGHTDHTIGKLGGNEDAITPYHNHTVTATQSGVSITGGGHSHKLRVHADTVASGSKYDRPNSWASGQAEGYTSSNVTHTHTLPAHTHTIGYEGTNGNATGANMQPYLAINYIIATGRFE